jgi:DNA-binding LytR/AlgR family response regulator
LEKLLHAIAIDDEPIALEILARHAAAIDWLDLQRVFISASEAVAWLGQNPVDVIFLDIRMPDVNGLELASRLPGKHQFIFTTAFADHAAPAFDLHATDYLLKPFSMQRFKTGCERALERLNTRKDMPPIQASHLFIKSGYDLIRIDIDKLLFIQSADNYLIFHEAGRQTVGRMTLTSMMERLPVRLFVRIHQSYIVSLAHVERFKDDALMIGRHRLPVSSKYKKEVLSLLK